jgi:hydroxypyruvate isomerase
MQRRTFIQRSLATLAGTTLLSQVLSKPPEQVPGAATFRMNYAPHDGMFKNLGGADFVDQIKFMHDQGFRAIEDNDLLKRPIADQERIGKTLSQLGMTMGVFVIEGGDNWKTSLTTGKKEFYDVFVNACKQSVEAAKRVNAKWMTVVPGYFERRTPVGIQTANVVEALRRGAEIFEPHGLIMVMEPLSDTPELFLRTSDQTYEICKAVNSPSCKILYDIYHMQRNEGNIINNIERCWDEIAYFQIGDNPGRKEPGTGEINYKNIFKYIDQRGYRGVMGMEHGNFAAGAEGEKAVIAAYRTVDTF